MKRILIHTSRKIFRKRLIKCSRYLNKYIGNFEYKIINNNGYKKINYQDYNLILTLGIDNVDIYNHLFKPFMDMNRNIVIFGSSIFLKDKQHRSYCVFVNGTHFTKFGLKRYDVTYDTNRISKFFKDEYSIKPWNNAGSKILILHYNTPTWDGLLKDKFYSKVYETCINSGRDIIFRTQPGQNYNINYLDKLKKLGFEIHKWSNVSPNNIQQSLNDCYCSVSYGGKSPSKSIIYGVPSITSGPNMAELVSECNINNILSPNKPDREQWFKWLSYCHWSEDELEDGSMWKYYFDNNCIKV